MQLLHGTKILSNSKGNIVTWSTSGSILIDCEIKTHNGLAAEIDFLHDTGPVWSQLAKSMAEPQ